MELRQTSGSCEFVCSSFAQSFGQVVSIKVKTLSNTNLVPLRHIRREKTFTYFQLTCVKKPNSIIVLLFMRNARS